MTDAAQSKFVYVTFIRTTPEQLWSALTGKDFMKQYWFGMHIETDWTQGAAWVLRFKDGSGADAGEIIEIDPPRRLVLRWRLDSRPELTAEGDAICTMDLEPVGDAVKLTVTHMMDRPNSLLIAGVSGGWPRIMSNLKSLLETGRVVI